MNKLKQLFSQFSHPLSRKLLWLLLIFIIGFGLQTLLNYSFHQFSENLDKQIANAEAQGILGKSLNESVNRIEKQFYQMTVGNNHRHRVLILNAIQQEADRINQIVDILEKGGTFVHHIRLNLPDKNDLERSLSFEPMALSQHNILRIDIQPKIRMILSEAERLQQYMDRLYVQMEDASQAELVEMITSNKQLIKHAMPLFVRLSENVNRVLYEQYEYFEVLKQEVAQKKAQYRLLQTILTVVVLLLGSLAFYWISLHIQKMTEELEVEKDRALSATQSKSNFLANMSHEIRTPLNAIIGFIGLLLAKESDEEKRKYLTTIEQSGHSLVNIINDILDFSKIESNKLALDPIDFDPREAFNATADLFKAVAAEKNIHLEIKIDDRLPPSLHADPLRLKQIINNLLSNAIKFTESDRSVELKIDYLEGQYLFVSVTDEGIGISPEHQEKIFEAFSQAENSTTRKFGGTGLGLAICAKLVDLLGGDLKLYSEVGGGSRFYFQIPIEEGRPLQVQPVVAQLDQFAGHLLLVEDNPTNQMLMKAILKKLNLTFDIANDGQEAVHFVEENSYDLILMDENMPNMNGIEATRLIRQREKALKSARVPIVALTANAMKGDRERFLAADMDDYLSKPLNLEELKRVLSLFVGFHRTDC